MVPGGDTRGWARRRRRPTGLSGASKMGSRSCERSVSCVRRSITEGRRTAGACSGEAAVHPTDRMLGDRPPRADWRRNGERVHDELRFDVGALPGDRLRNRVERIRVTSWRWERARQSSPTTVGIETSREVTQGARRNSMVLSGFARLGSLAATDVMRVHVQAARFDGRTLNARGRAREDSKDVS